MCLGLRQGRRRKGSREEREAGRSRREREGEGGDVQEGGGWLAG